MRHVLIFLIRLYQATLSPVWRMLLGPSAGCRFTPNCSAYAIEALRKHGAWRGLVLAAKRVGRCHPWCKGGVDEVPDGRDR